MWLQYDIFAQYQFAHGLFCLLVESLAFLRRINKSDTDLDLRFAEDPHFYRSPLHNARDASGDRHVVQDQGVCSGWELILAKNSKSTGENSPMRLLTLPVQSKSKPSCQIREKPKQSQWQHKHEFKPPKALHDRWRNPKAPSAFGFLRQIYKGTRGRPEFLNFA